MFMFVLALLPIIWLIIALSILRLPGYIACVTTLIITILLASIVWEMPTLHIITASMEGIISGLWSIIFVILSAMFVYNITIHTKAMDQIKIMLASVSTDKRILMLLIAFGFGNFMEGIAGFGTAVAIPAGILVGLGFNPLQSIVVCLVINSAPTAFGGVGIPTNTMASLTGLESLQIARSVVFVQSIIQFITPFIAVMIIGEGKKALKGMYLFIFIVSISFMIPQFVVAYWIGADLANIFGAIVAMIVITISAKLLKNENDDYRVSTPFKYMITLKEAIIAWIPFMLILFFLLLTSTMVSIIHHPLSSIHSKLQIYSGLNPSTLTFYWLNSPGLLILIAGLIGGLIQKAKLYQIFQILKHTIISNLKTMITITSVLAVAKIMGYSGMTSNIALVLVATTGIFFPFISPLIGAVGGLVTGSGPSTAALFGKLQVETAQAIGIRQEWLAAATLTGAGIGKMLSPQGIAIGCAAVGMENSEGQVIAHSLKWLIIFVLLTGIVCFILPIMRIV